MASAIELISRRGKESDDSLAIKNVDNIPAEQACFLYLGGSGANTDNAALRYTDIIQDEILDDLHIDMPIYTVQYIFDDNDDLGDRAFMFDKHRTNIVMPSAGPVHVMIDKNNINHIIDKVILPRIVQNGKALDNDTLQRRLHGVKLLMTEGEKNLPDLKIKFFELLEQKMRAVGYDEYNVFNAAYVLGQKIKTEQDLHDEYLEDIFNAVFLPRISNNDGKLRLPLDVAMRRIRKINIVAHCHGAYVVLKMEEKIKNKMRELGYNQKEINDVLGQMLTVALAPGCPLGVSKTRMISFASAYDMMIMRPRNWVAQYIKANQAIDMPKLMNGENVSGDWLYPSFLSDKNGEVFLIRMGFKWVRDNGQNGPSSLEHNNARFVQGKEKSTNDGRLIFGMARNILKNATLNSVAQDDGVKPLPPTRELVSIGDDNTERVFDMLTQNGDSFMTRVHDFGVKNAKQMHEANRLMR